MRGLYAPPRSIEAPPAATARATSAVCSADSTVHGPAIRQKVAPTAHGAAAHLERRRRVV